MEDILAPIAICGMLFIGLPWMFLHYSTQWRKAKGISVEDEQLLDDLHDMARRLDARLDSIERIITADHPGWKDGALKGPVDRPEPLTERRAEPRFGQR